MTLSYKIHTATTGDVNGRPLGYSFNFPSLSANDITVTVGGDPKTITSDYTVENWTADAGNNPYIEFTSSTARGTGTIRISRGTTSTSPTHDFQVGSAIKAADLNSCNQQNIYLAQENRDSINALALGDASSAIQIDSANIKNLTIQAIDLATDAVETDKIKDLNVTTDKINNLAVTEGKIADNNVTANKLKSSSSTDSDRAVTTNHIRDGAVTDAKLSTISGSKINPNFGSQNITTTGTLNAGTTTTGSTTSQDLTITNNLTLSDGNADNKGLFFNGDPLGGTDDKAFLRYYSDTGSNGDTRLHLGCLGDTNDEIYLESHKVHTSNNLEVGGVLSAASFLGLPVQDVKVAWNTTETNFGNNSSWHTHLEVGPFTDVTSSSKFLVVAVYEIKNESNSTNCSTEARITEVGGTLIPNATNTRQGNSYVKYTHIEFDRANNSSNRTYRLQCRATNSHTSCNAFMDDAFLAVFHLKPS